MIGNERTLDFDSIREKLKKKVKDEKLMDGRRVAKLVRQDVRRHMDELKALGKEPTLAVVLVGDNEASQTYVKSKVKACKDVGITSIKRVMPNDTTQEDLNNYLNELNLDQVVDGILLQLPLPSHLNKVEAINQISPLKDVDGFHPLNLGLLMAQMSHLEACTPRGVMIMLMAYDIDLCGANACVIGRSVMVGRPMAQMLVRANATVTMCHRHTKDLAEIVRRSDIVVAAAGVPELVKGEWIKPGAVVVDVGINYVDGQMVGDVEYDVARENARLITPVPGGVGPMTVAALMANTAHAAWYNYENAQKEK